MKASRKIEIMQHEYCNIFFEKIHNKTNIISIDFEKIEAILNKCNYLIEKGYDFNIIPFVNTGYFDVILDDGKHLAFSFSFSSEENKMTMDVFYDSESKKTVNICGNTYPATFFVSEISSELPGNNYEDFFIDQVSIYEIYYSERNIDNYVNFIPDDFLELLEKTKHIYLSLFYIFAYINYLSEYPEYKIIDGNPKKEKRKNTNKKKISNSKNFSNESEIKSIDLNGIKIVTKNKKIISKIKSRKPIRYTSSWNVRGHYRHYKSGKTVYIKPFKKGTDEKAIDKAKKYIID